MKNYIMGVLLLGSLVVTAAPPSGQPGQKMPPVKVLCERVTMAPNTAVRRYVGHVKAVDSVALPARVSGILQKINFVEGDIVQKGQLLFEIEDTTYRAKADQAKAQVMQAQAQLDYAKVDYARQKDLRATKAVSEAVYEESLRTLRTAEASLANAKAVLLDADNNLSYTKVYAPFTGLIGKATYTTGNYVTPTSSNLGTVVRLSPIYVCFALSERDYLEMFGDYKTMMRDGVTHYRMADGKDYPLAGRIQLMDNQVDDTTGTITAWSLVENPKLQLLPGGFTTVSLANKTAPVMAVIKLSAVMADARGNFVYVVNSGKIELRYVKLANTLNGRQFIESGLKAGDIVVTDGTNRVRPGSDAEPVFPADAARK